MTMNAELNTQNNTATLSLPETNENLYPCDRCGTLHPIENLSTVGSSKDMYCLICRSRLWPCFCCDAPIDLDCERHYETHDGETICESCAEDHEACTFCGGLVHPDDAQYIEERGAYACQTCFEENYFACEECGEIIPNEQVRRYAGRCLCEYCYDRAVEEDEENEETIMSYHSDSRPDLRFFHTEDERKTTAFTDLQPLYMGLELEVDKGGFDHDNAYAVLDILGWEHAFAERDSSLNNGFEIVTQPFTLGYYTETLSRRFVKALQELKDLDYASHDTNTCGLHVHVNRAALGSTPGFQDYTIAKIWTLMYHFPQELLQFSRRSASKLDEWAALPAIEDIEDESLRQNLEELDKLVYEVKKTGRRCRYKALNLTNTDTIEFRLFRGTLNHDTLTATLQFVHNLCCLAQALSHADCLRITWAQLHNMLIIHSPELEAYMKKRGLAPKAESEAAD